MATYTCFGAGMEVKVHTSISRHNTVHARLRQVLRNRPISRKMDAISSSCGGRTISCFSENSLHERIVVSTQRDKQFKQTLLSVLGGVEVCSQPVHWTCFLEMLALDVAVMQQECVTFVPRFLTLNPCIRICLLSVILEHHSEISGETLKFFATTVEGWLAADTWEAYLVGRLRERSNSVSSGAVCPSSQCLEEENVHSAGNVIQLSGDSGKEVTCSLVNPEDSTSSTTVESEHTPVVMKSGQKRQPCEENAPYIKSPTLSSENPLTSDLKSENGSRRNIGDVDTISEELKKSCSWLASYWNSDQEAAIKSEESVHFAILNQYDASTIGSLMTSGDSMSNMNEVTVLKILQHLSTMKGVVLNSAIIVTLLQRTVCHWVLSSKSLSRSVQGALCQMAGRFMSECIVGLLLPMATSRNLCGAHLNLLKRITKDLLPPKGKLFFLSEFLKATINNTLLWTESHVELLKVVIEEVETLEDCHVEGLVLCMNASSPVLEKSMKFSSLLLLMLTRFHHLFLSHGKEVEKCIQRNKTFLQKKLLKTFMGN